MEYYYYLYYRIYNFSKALSDDAINEWKPVILISGLQAIIVTQIFIWYIVITKRSYEVSNLFLFLLAFASISLNYYIFLYKNKWKKYIHKFKGFTKRQVYFRGTIILIIIFLILVGLVYAFYQLSLIDWKKINGSKYYD